jgi:hypothetical protein
VIRFFKNPWTYILLGPASLFGLLAMVGVEPDTVVLTFGFLLFLVVAVSASKYAFRAPALIFEGNVNNDSVNIVGFALVLVSLMATQTYRWIFISLGRPEWLTQTYWVSGFVYTMFVGFALVAWSTRRTTPKPVSGRIGLSGFFVGFLSAIGLMLSGILPAVTKFVLGLFGGLTRVL